MVENVNKNMGTLGINKFQKIHYFLLFREFQGVLHVRPKNGSLIQTNDLFVILEPNCREKV